MSKKPVNKKEKKPRSVGRPALEFTQELKDRLEVILTSDKSSLENIVKKYPDLPSIFTFKKWKIHKPEFATFVALCRNELAEEYIAEARRVLRNTYLRAKKGLVSMPEVAAANNLAHFNKYLAAKWAQATYGEKANPEANQPKSVSIRITKKTVVPIDE